MSQPIGVIELVDEKRNVTHWTEVSEIVRITEDRAKPDQVVSTIRLKNGEELSLMDKSGHVASAWVKLLAANKPR